MSSSPLPAPRGLRSRAGTLCVLALLTLAGVATPAALGAGFENGQALKQLNEAAAEETTTTATTAKTTTETTNSKSVILLASGGAIVLLCAIGFVIARDARKVAPAGPDDLGESRSAADSKVALEKRRAKAKAARKQRKRTR